MTINVSNNVDGRWVVSEVFISSGGLGDQLLYAPFRIRDVSEIQVWQFDSITDFESRRLLEHGVDWQILGTQPPQGTFTDVYFDLIEIPPAGTVTFCTLKVDKSQQTRFTSQGFFFPEYMESALDKLTQIVLEQDRKVNRSMRLPDWYFGDMPEGIWPFSFDSPPYFPGEPEDTWSEMDTQLPVPPIPGAYFRWSEDGKRIVQDRDVTPDPVASQIIEFDGSDDLELNFSEFRSGLYPVTANRQVTGVIGVLPGDRRTLTIRSTDSNVRTVTFDSSVFKGTIPTIDPSGAERFTVEMLAIEDQKILITDVIEWTD